MNFPTRRESVAYMRNQALAQFIGFCIGIYSTSLVATFFETRSISNLWGLLARKTIVDEGTFNLLERVVAVLIGFLVFEIVSRNLKPLLERLGPVISNEIVRFAKEQRWDAKWKKLTVDLRIKSSAIFAFLKGAACNAARKHFSK